MTPTARSASRPERRCWTTHRCRSRPPGSRRAYGWRTCASCSSGRTGGCCTQTTSPNPTRRSNGPLAEHAQAFLGDLADELRATRLHYEADHALQNIAYLHIAGGRVTRFAPAAAALGSDHWMPIVALAKAAISRCRPDIARDVFAVANQPGRQRDYLHERCIELTGSPPATHLSLVERAPEL